MKTEAYAIKGSKHVVVDCFTSTEGKSSGTSLDLDEAWRARQMLAELSELIPAKDYFDLIAQLDKAMTEIDSRRLEEFREVAA